MSLPSLGAYCAFAFTSSRTNSMEMDANGYPADSHHTSAVSSNSSVTPRTSVPASSQRREYISPSPTHTNHTDI